MPGHVSWPPHRVDGSRATDVGDLMGRPARRTTDRTRTYTLSLDAILFKIPDDLAAAATASAVAVSRTWRTSPPSL